MWGFGAQPQKPPPRNQVHGHNPLCNTEKSYIIELLWSSNILVLLKENQWSKYMSTTRQDVAKAITEKSLRDTAPELLELSSQLGDELDDAAS